jgi:hypothetical protein
LSIRSSYLTIAAVSLSFVLAGCGKKDGGSVAGEKGAAGASAVSSAAASAKPDDGGMLGKLKQAVASDVTITRKPRKVGEKRKVDHTTSMNLKIKLGPKEIAVNEDEINKRTEEVLALTGDVVSKVKVTYEQRTKTKNEDGRTGAPDKNVLAGKTFIVEHKDAKLLVTTEDGKAVDAASKSAVEKDFKKLGKPDVVNAALPTRPLKVGEEVKELSAAVSEEMKENMDAEKAGLSIESPKVVLDRQDGDGAVFSLTMLMRISKGPLKGTIPVTGSVTVRTRDGAMLRSDTAGPINLDISEADKKRGVSGGGNVKSADTYTYL